MGEILAMLAAPPARLRDLVDLGKPRLSLLVVFTSAIGLWLAPTKPGALRSALFLAATLALVAAANVLNCWAERELDGLMVRTRGRPLPAGRISHRLALWIGVALSTIALATLALTTDPLTTSLGGAALTIYVLVYTPLKRITPWALPVGAVPGALPPLMGWTAATGSLALPGWFAFGILFLWQLPHFAAIALELKEDFRRAGFRVMPLVLGDRATRSHLFCYTVLLLLFSLSALPLGLAGVVYTTVAGVLGGAFVYLAGTGLRRTVDAGWARRVFGYSLVYLPILIAVLVLDGSRAFSNRQLLGG